MLIVVYIELVRLNEFGCVLRYHSNTDACSIIILIIIYLFGVSATSFVVLHNILQFKRHKKIYVYNKTITTVLK